MNWKRIRKNTARTVFFLFLLFNFITCNHAYHFTHFAEHPVDFVYPTRLGVGGKLWALFFGISIPKPRNESQPSQPFETHRIASGADTLELWAIPPAADSGRGAVVLFHGFGSKKEHLLEKAAVFHAWGFEAILVDFRGSGGSTGTHCTIGYEESKNVESAYAFARKRHPTQKIYAFGSSMGAVAILKSESEAAQGWAGLILECPFGSMQEAVAARVRLMGLPSFPITHGLMFWGSVQNGFWTFAHRPTEYAKQVQTPCLLLYGGRDNRVNFSEIEAIYDNLPARKQLHVFPDAYHIIFLRMCGGAWEQAVGGFLGAS